MRKLFKILFLAAIAIGGSNLQAQNVANQAVSSAGGSGTFGNGYSLFYTVGEVVINTGGSGNVQLTQGFNQKIARVTLPVIITSIKVSAEASRHLVKWTTSMELNNDYFIVEHSSDGKLFTPLLGKVYSKAVNGNSITPLAYSYANANVVNGDNYYRLKQFDRDGEYKYSEVVHIKSDGLTVAAFALHPNPVRQNATFTVTGNLGQSAKLRIISITGQQLAEIKVTSNATPVTLENLSAGTYLLQYEDGGQKRLVKFVKL